MHLNDFFLQSIIFGELLIYIICFFIPLQNRNRKKPSSGFSGGLCLLPRSCTTIVIVQMKFYPIKMNKNQMKAYLDYMKAE